MAPSKSKEKATQSASALSPEKAIPKSKKPKRTAAAAASETSSPATPRRRPSNISRLWQEEDEKKLLEALCEFKEQRKRLPHSDDYATFLRSFPPNHFSFPANHHHLSNKLKVFKDSFNKALINPSSVEKGHKTFVFEKCRTLFGTNEVEEQADGDDGAYPYPFMLNLVEDSAREYPSLMQVSFDHITESLGVPMIRAWEKKLAPMMRSSTKQKMREQKLKTKILAKILAKVHET